jgi:hypothetical protein
MIASSIHILGTLEHSIIQDIQDIDPVSVYYIVSFVGSVMPRVNVHRIMSILTKNNSRDIMAVSSNGIIVKLSKRVLLSTSWNTSK